MTPLNDEQRDTVLSLVAVIAFVYLLAGIPIGYGLCKYFNPPVELTLVEKQRIAIEYMCSPGQSWKGMKYFCGSQVMDGRVK